MEWIQAILLGIIQGVTEFLPVSSSGHLELGKVLLNYDPGDDLLFDVVLHAATLLSTLLVYRKDILELLKGIFSTKWNKAKAFAAKVLLSMVPVMAVYVLLKDQIDAIFESSDERFKLLIVGSCLLFTAAVLGLTVIVQKRAEEDIEVGWKQAIIMGIAQAIALLPGVSRAGSTIASGLLAGAGREKAARFSFLMVLPPIAGGTLLEIKDVLTTEGAAEAVSVGPLLAGFVAAFVAGWIACVLMIRIVKRGKLVYFAGYCVLVGLIAIVSALTILS